MCWEKCIFSNSFNFESRYFLFSKYCKGYDDIFLRLFLSFHRNIPSCYLHIFIYSLFYYDIFSFYFIRIIVFFILFLFIYFSTHYCVHKIVRYAIKEVIQDFATFFWDEFLEKRASLEKSAT